MILSPNTANSVNGLYYSDAMATIIPIMSESASVGLPELILNKGASNCGDSQHDIAEKAVGLEFDLGNSVYNTRGWTFQERILSNAASSTTITG